MYTIDSFLPYVHPDLPSAPLGLIKENIMLGLQDIAKIRGTMIEFLEPLELINGDHFVALDDEYYADELICVKLNGNEIPRKAETCSHENMCGGSLLSHKREWYLSGDDDQTGGNQLWFTGIGTHNTGRGRSVCVTVDHKQPDPSRIPDYIFRDYRVAVTEYVLWRLKQMNNKPWSDKTQAEMIHRKQWYIERRRIKNNAMLRLYGGRPRAQIPLNDFSAAGRGSTFGAGGINRIFRGGAL